MPTPAALAIMVDTGLPEAQAQAAADSLLRFFGGNLSTATLVQVQQAMSGIILDVPQRYNTPGFGTLARSFDQLRPVKIPR
jgi:hypothetical protein